MKITEKLNLKDDYESSLWETHFCAQDFFVK